MSRLNRSFGSSSVFQRPLFTILIVLPSYLEGGQNKGAARARPPSHPRGEAGRGATRSRPDPASRPRPQLAPADCGHVTPRANREGPGRARRGLLPHHKHGPETAERAAARGPGLAAVARGRPTAVQQSHPALRRPSGAPRSLLGPACELQGRVADIHQAGQTQSQHGPPPGASARGPGRWLFFKRRRAAA